MVTQGVNTGVVRECSGLFPIHYAIMMMMGEMTGNIFYISGEHRERGPMPTLIMMNFLNRENIDGLSRETQ